MKTQILSVTNVMEKFCDLFSLRPSDLIIALTYFVMDNVCPCLLLFFFVEINFRFN